MKKKINQIILYFKNNEFTICFTSEKCWFQKDVIVYLKDASFFLNEDKSFKNNILDYTTNIAQVKLQNRVKLFLKEKSINISSNQILLVPFNTFYLYNNA